MTRLLNERGQAMIETALTLPLVLLLSISVFEFGRAFQYWQVMTNAAREGARFAALPGTTQADVIARVQAYLQNGAIAGADTADVNVNQNADIDLGGGNIVSGSTVTVNYPFQFYALEPLSKLLVADSTAGNAFTMTVSATMRNE